MNQLLFFESERLCRRSLNSLSVSRSGKSSGELSSVMIRNPVVGNSLEQEVNLQNITNMSNNKLFVGNLSFNTTENDLQNTFAAHGTVLEANLMMDRVSGRPRGFGFVTLSTPEEAQNAINALNGAELDGRALTVNVAKPREERSGNGGGRREYSGARNRY
jgi:cold-inducible RNA-binding protein